MGLNGVHHLSVESASGADRRQSQPVSQTGHAGASFGELLLGKVNESLNFSKHAAKRMDERGIRMDSRLLGNLEQAVEAARQKGARDVAVIGREGVFIVNVPNNIVVTTMSQDDTEKKILTNIDSAVLM